MTQNERIRQFAGDNKDLAGALKEKFPEAFENDRLIDLKVTKKPFIQGFFTEYGCWVALIAGGLISREGIRGKSIILSDYYEWEFTQNNGYHVLIPRRK